MDVSIEAGILIIYFLAVNIAAFVTYGVDKSRAIRDKWRIPEATLIGLAIFGGAFGALLGMRVWHHKTRKWKFRILVPVFLVLWTMVLWKAFS